MVLCVDPSSSTNLSLSNMNANHSNHSNQHASPLSSLLQSPDSSLVPSTQLDPNLFPTTPNPSEETTLSDLSIINPQQQQQQQQQQQIDQHTGSRETKDDTKLTHDDTLDQTGIETNRSTRLDSASYKSVDRNELDLPEERDSKLNSLAM